MSNARLCVFLAALAFAALLPVRGPAAQCLTIDGQSYCKAWSDRNDWMSKTEFVRKGETVDHWQNMVTILRFDGLDSAHAVAKKYLSMVGSYIRPPGSAPVWIVPSGGAHADAAATRTILAADGVQPEYVVVYLFHDAGQPGYAIVFSQHLPLPGDDPTKADYGRWLHAMAAVPAQALVK